MVSVRRAPSVGLLIRRHGLCARCNHAALYALLTKPGAATSEDKPMATTVERVQVHQDGHWSSRTISILAALAVDVGLVWLLFFRAKYNPPVGEAELFWVRVIAAFGTYAVLQQWTLANQTGRGDDVTSALDKFVAASPIVVAAVIEAYWLGAEGAAALSWRHHAVAALWSAFAITDFFATDITNQRLRARQFNVGDGGVA
jgi:hypothetical protein